MRMSSMSSVAGTTVVRQVLPGTPAGQIGLFSGDVISAVDGIPINSADDLSNIMDQRRPGDTIMLTWIDRAGIPRNAPLVLAKGPVG
jgi:S1-C subfamily serine protease